TWRTNCLNATHPRHGSRTSGARPRVARTLSRAASRYADLFALIITTKVLQRDAHYNSSRADVVSPLISHHTATVISNTAIGSHTNCVTAPRSTPASWSGRTTTSTAEPRKPTHANHSGIMRPRSRSQQKLVLPTAKRAAPTRGF